MAKRHSYRIPLSDAVAITVRYVHDRGEVTGFAVVLVLREDDRWRTVRLFDHTHQGRNDMHRYTRDGGKQDAESFHYGTPGEAMRAAIDLISRGFEGMIDAWRR